MNLKTIALLFFAAHIGYSILITSFYLDERRSSERMRENMAVMNSKMEYAIARDGRAIAQTETMNLQLSEMKRIFPEMLTEIKNLKIKPGRVEQGSQTGVNTHTTVNTILRDSIIHDTIPVKIFDYRDDWFDVKGIQIRDSQELDISYQDTLTQIIYRGERIRPWLWIFSKRKIMQRAYLSYPGSKILFQQTIKIQK